MLFLVSKAVAIGAVDQASCVPLSGIVTGGQIATNTLDLDEIKVSMSVEMFHLSNPVIPAVAECSTGWVNNRGPGWFVPIDQTPACAESVVTVKYRVKNEE